MGTGIGIPGVHPSAAAIESIVAQHGNRIYQLAYRLTHSASDAEDIVQEVFIKLFRGWMHLSSCANLSAWITRVVTNASIDLLRARKTQERRIDSRALTSLPGPSASPSQAPESEEARRKLNEAVAGLPAQQKAAIILYDHEGLSGKEVARILGTQEATVRRYVFEARRRVRDILAPYLAGGDR